MSCETENTPEDIILIDPVKSLRIIIQLIQCLILLIKMKQIFIPVLNLLMWFFCKKEPIQFSLFTPLTKLCELLSHKEKLLSRMSHHKCICHLQVAELIPSFSRHLIQHGAFQMNNLIMRKYKNIVL